MFSNTICFLCDSTKEFPRLLAKVRNSLASLLKRSLSKTIYLSISLYNYFFTYPYYFRALFFRQIHFSNVLLTSSLPLGNLTFNSARLLIRLCTALKLTKRRSSVITNVILLSQVFSSPACLLYFSIHL